MKTPHEILLNRHQSAAPKLDAIRETVVATMGDHGRAKVMASSAATDSGGNLHEFLFSLRWHLAGMSAIWLIVALLNLSAGHSPGMVAAVPRGEIPSAQIIMASLRENRRELLQMIQSPNSHDAEPQRLILPQPRSQRRYEKLTV